MKDFTIKINFSNVSCIVLSIMVLCTVSGFSSFTLASLKAEADEFKPTNCTNDEQCQQVCFQGGFLESRCDANGVCVCDCSDETIVNSSWTQPCSGRQPDGIWRDYCDKYCNQEYLRPFRWCKFPSSDSCCTCVCVYPHPS